MEVQDVQNVVVTVKVGKTQLAKSYAGIATSKFGEQNLKDKIIY